MRVPSLLIVVCVLISTDVRCDIPEKLKNDFFQIYKGLTLDTMERTGTGVTRDKLTFTLFNKNNMDNGTVITSDNLLLVQPTQDKIIFIIHGWNSYGAVDWVLNMKDAFLKTYQNSSVITVDWKDAADELYTISALNAYGVGNFVGDMIIDLISNYKVDIKKLLIVGHSLGGQACGFAGKKIQSVGRVLPRIVALDPAGPLFDGRPIDKRLNPADAEVVEVIHSDEGRFGFSGSCGTIDFFPNGGRFQPGCTSIDLFDIRSVGDAVICDHQRSYEYFTEAIPNPTSFLTTLCTKYNIFVKECDNEYQVSLGDLTTTMKGNFYFETNKQWPFAKRKRES